MDLNPFDPSALPPGRIKAQPEDFRVDELPLYAPSGQGGHAFVRIEKVRLSTDEAVRALAAELRVPPRDVGVAGLKDKHAVTTQWLSFPVPQAGRAGAGEAFLERVRAVSVPNVRVLEASLHDHKLKTGHVGGNAFDLVIRGVPRGRAEEVLARLAATTVRGVPNAFGPQRFGAKGDNVERALAWLRGDAAPPRDPRQMRFHWSAVQSWLFNEVLARRLADGTWAIPLDGDLLKKEASGGLFHCTDVTTDRGRAEAFEVSPTGPMFGVKMDRPTGAPDDLEQGVLHEGLGPSFDLGKVRRLGEGTRRPLRFAVRGLVTELQEDAAGRPDECAIRARFVLPKGAYATTVLATAVRVLETTTGSRASVLPAVDSTPPTVSPDGPEAPGPSPDDVLEAEL